MSVYEFVTAVLLRIDTDKKTITVHVGNEQLPTVYTYVNEPEEDFIMNNLGKEYIELVVKDNVVLEMREPSEE